MSDFPVGFFSHTGTMLESHQNTMGQPLQFHYLGSPGHPTHSTREHVAINLSPFSDVPQNSQKDPIIGQYHSMVYDVPFDVIHDRNTNSNLSMYGLGFLALAAMLF